MFFKTNLEYFIPEYIVGGNLAISKIKFLWKTIEFNKSNYKDYLIFINTPVRL